MFCAAITSANDSVNDCGGNATGKVNVRSYCVMVVMWIAGCGLRSKPSNCSSASARVNCRARSDLKLKKMTLSPSRISPIGWSSASTIVPGSMNSSETPASYDFRMYSTADRLRGPPPLTIESYAFFVRSQRLSRSIP